MGTFFTIGMQEQGTVKWFNARKGYGFIARNNGEDVFVHHSGIRTRGNVHRHLVEGENVVFVCETWDADGGQRTRAAEVRHRDHESGGLLSCEINATAPGAWTGPPRNIQASHCPADSRGPASCGWSFEKKSDEPSECILVDKSGRRWKLVPAEESEE